MEALQVKKEMMKLWKETFHDSDEYISLIFDNYFDENLIAYKMENGHVVSALLGVPYEFGGYGIEENCEAGLKGLYLCGLATRKDKRGRGYMRELINEINGKAKLQGFDFTFLIPASEELKDYYRSNFYHDAFYCVVKNYTEVHDFKKELMASDKASLEVFEKLKVDEFEKDNKVLRHAIAEYIRNCERGYATINNLHTDKDINIAIDESFISGNKILIYHEPDFKIGGVAFCDVSADDKIKINFLLHDNLTARFKLLDYVKNKYPDKQIELKESAEILSPEEPQLWEPYYICAPEGYENLHQTDERIEECNINNKSFSYGMMRIVNIKKIGNYILHLIRSNKEFAASLVCKNGDLDGFLREVEENFKEFKENDLVKFLLRKPDAGNLLSCSLGLVRLPMAMHLMLD